MGHQDTKLTSMRPRLKELNDIPYIDFIASDQATALARRYYGSDIVLHSTYSALSTDKTSVLLSFLISSLFLSNMFSDRVLLDLS